MTLTCSATYLVVLGVVNLHDLSRDDGLELAVVVWQIGKGVLAANKGANGTSSTEHPHGRVTLVG
jgi:hypothetical protein